MYIIAQNERNNFGGVTLANCKKIAAVISRAAKTATPIVYLLNSYGVEVGEGVNVLAGIAEVLSASAEIKGFVPQIAIVIGKVYGSISLLAAACDAGLIELFEGNWLDKLAQSICGEEVKNG